jgi:hypothetical protein
VATNLLEELTPAALDRVVGGTGDQLITRDSDSADGWVKPRRWFGYEKRINKRCGVTPQAMEPVQGQAGAYRLSARGEAALQRCRRDWLELR